MKRRQELSEKDGIGVQITDVHDEDASLPGGDGSALPGGGNHTPPAGNNQAKTNDDSDPSPERATGHSRGCRIYGPTTPSRTANSNQTNISTRTPASGAITPVNVTVLNKSQFNEIRQPGMYVAPIPQPDHLKETICFVDHALVTGMPID